MELAQGPIPEPFLDVQEGLEEDITNLTYGLPDFLRSIVEQWKTADEIFWTVHSMQGDTINLERELENALLILPDHETARTFTESLELILQTLRKVDANDIPLLLVPEHDQIVDQEAANTSITFSLRATLNEAFKTADRTERAVKLYTDAAEALIRSRTILEQVESLMKQFKGSHAQISFELAPKRPRLDNETCVTLSWDAQPLYITTRDGIETTLHDLKSKSQALSHETLNCLAELARTGVDPNVYRQMEDALNGLDQIQQSTRQAFTDEQDLCQFLLRTREAWDLLENVIEDYCQKAELLTRAIPNLAWKSLPAARSDDILLLVTDYDEVMNRAMCTVEPLSQELKSRSYTRLFDYFELGSARLFRKVSACKALAAIRASVQNQADQMEIVENFAVALEADLHKFDESLQPPANSDDTMYTPAESLSYLLRELTSRVDNFSHQCVKNIPLVERQSSSQIDSSMLGSSPSIYSILQVSTENGPGVNELKHSTSFKISLSAGVFAPGFDLSAQDALVREWVNTNCSWQQAKLQAISEKLDLRIFQKKVQDEEKQSDSLLAPLQGCQSVTRDIAEKVKILTDCLRYATPLWCTPSI